MITGPRACPHAAGDPDRSIATTHTSTRTRGPADTGTTRPLSRVAPGLGVSRARRSGMVSHAISGPERRQEILLFFRKLSENIADEEERARHTNYGGARLRQRQC